MSGSWLPELIVRRRGWIALGWLALAIGLLPQARHAAKALGVSAAEVREGEGAQAERMLIQSFDSPYEHYAVLVLDGVPRPDSPPGRALLAEVVGRIESVRDVTGSLSYLSTGEPSFIGSRTTFLIIGLANVAESSDATITRLRAVTAELSAGWGQKYPGATASWTGGPALNLDIRLASSQDATAAEGRALPLTLLLLLLAFGSVGAAILPLAAGGLAIALSLGASVLISRGWPLGVVLVNIVSMLGLGVGIDYALLTVHRFREGLAAGLTPQDAATESVRHAGHAVLLSGVSVAVGFMALLIVPAVELRSLAVGGLLVITASVLIATTLLPGALAFAGRRIDIGALSRLSGRRNGAERWRAWGSFVAAHPMGVLLVASLPVLLLAWPVRRMTMELPSGDWLPKQMESSRATAALRSMSGSGIVQTVRLLVRLPEGRGAISPQGWRALCDVAEALRGDPRAARVISLPGLVEQVRTRQHPLDATRASAKTCAAEDGGPDPDLLPLVPADLLRTYLGTDSRDVLIEVVPREGESPAAMVKWVRELRGTDPVALRGLPGTRVFVAGMPALNADYQDLISRRAPVVVALVVGGTLIALMVGFRSVLIAVKAVALNLLSVAAAFGAAVLVFQDGIGASLLGLAGPVDGLFPAVPLIVFCVVFGLSMDYEVFLMARMAECHRAGLDDAQALAEGMARTAGVITSAATIMIGVFASFAAGDFLIIKILGFCLATAVFLDATIVRVAIGPALFRLAGRWNWWPGMIIAALALSGCSVRSIAVKSLGDALAEGGSTYASDDDPELVGAAVPFGLKSVEGLLQSSPRHKGLLLAACNGFAQYAFSWVQQEADFAEATSLTRAIELRQRARKLYLRGHEYGFRGLALGSPGLREGLRRDARSALVTVGKQDVPLLYCTAAAWAAAMALQIDDSELSADRTIAEAMARRALSLDEEYEAGAIHEFFIAYESARAAVDGSRGEARRHLERAVGLARGRRASPYVTFAENVCVREQNRGEFREMLEKALSIDVSEPTRHRTANLLAQKRARWLLGRVEELFVE